MPLAPAAFRATFSDLKVIKTRKCVQIVFELPIEQFDAAYEVLGGLPNPAEEKWFGIAALKKEALGSGDQDSEPLTAPTGLPSRKGRSWAEMKPSQQAGIRIGEPSFSAFLKENYPDEWHETGDADACIKFVLRIGSKRDLEINQKARVLWNALDHQYQAWKVVEHA